MITKKCQGCDIAAKINQAEKKNKKRRKRNKQKKEPQQQNYISKIAFFQGGQQPAYFSHQKMHFLNYETKEFLSFFLSDFV